MYSNCRAVYSWVIFDAFADKVKHHLLLFQHFVYFVDFIIKSTSFAIPSTLFPFVSIS